MSWACKGLSVADVADLIGVIGRLWALISPDGNKQQPSGDSCSYLGKSLDYSLVMSGEAMTLMLGREGNVCDGSRTVLQRFRRYVEAPSLANVKTAFVPNLLLKLVARLRSLRMTRRK